MTGPSPQPSALGNEPARTRIARRTDVPALVDLRVRYLAETARLEPRFALLPDVRERTSHVMPVWIGQDDRIVLVAEVGSEGAATTVGYATGLAGVWPPVLRQQHVGEVSEVFVLPDRRGAGIGRRLLAELTRALEARGTQVVRAPVPVRNEALLARFRALGYEPLQLVMERNLEEP